MNIFRRLLFWLGVITLIHFPITGALMRYNVFHISHNDITVRMMFRANHIYIVMTGLINMLLYFATKNIYSKWLLQLAAFILLASTVTLNIAFYIDPVGGTLHRQFTAFSIFGVFGGTLASLLYLQFSKRNPGTELTN